MTDITAVQIGRTYRITTRRGSGTVRLLRQAPYPHGVVCDWLVVDGEFRCGGRHRPPRAKGAFVCLRLSEISKILPDR